MNDLRPDPDALLAKVERDAAKARRGRLKIFFGAAAGVGKTYAMLLAARERRAERVDIVAGLVETHSRRETAALLEGLEILPPRRTEYRGTMLQEFDLDAALKRRPAILLVDELAHSNAPGSRHPKRWQDVEELLDAGIDVYTTLNVQHLESLNDDVGQIAGIRVWETVPDTVFESADELELVDLPPDELLLRLKEGKVYLPQQAEQAIQSFFRKGNLIALRELALRQTANRVDAQMLDYREGQGIRAVWPAGERILVCIGPNGDLGERLVRAGKRLAAGLRGDWVVVYVETPPLQRLPAERRDAILGVLRLAEQLGAQTVTLSATDMGAALINFAQERNVTKIVMGKPSRRGWRRWLFGSVVDTLIAHAHNINIYLLGSPAVEVAEAAARGSVSPKPWQRGRQRKPGYYRGYAWAVLISLFSASVGVVMFGRFDLANLVMVFLLGVVFVATRFGRGPSILASLLGTAIFDFMFVPPYWGFSVADSQNFMVLLTMLIVGGVISHLMANVRSQAKVAAHRERRALVLFAMTTDLATGKSETDIVRAATRHLYSEFGCRNVVLFPDQNGRVTFPTGKMQAQSLSAVDLSVAQWVFDHNESAGQGTHTLPGASATYFPISHDNSVLGVLALAPVNLRRIFLPEQKKLLDTFLHQIAQALVRVQLAEQAQAVALQMEAERLRNTLLGSISHDLRTPLATIVGSASTLVEQDDSLPPADRQNLSRCIYEEAVRMSRLIANILDMARLDAGAVKLNREWHVLEELVGTVLSRFETSLRDRPLSVRLPRDLPLIYVDGIMIEQVLANLLENALRYTPDGTPIEIAAEGSDFAMTISVADRGPGIPAGQEEKLFEKFSRMHPERAQSGVGLGLAICKAIVDAHGGWIGARTRGTGGAIFTFTIPLDRAQPTIDIEPEAA